MGESPKGRAEERAALLKKREKISDDSRTTLKVQERRDRMPDKERRSFREMDNVLPACDPLKEEISIDEQIEKIEIFEQFYGWMTLPKFIMLFPNSQVSRRHGKTVFQQKNVIGQYGKDFYRKPSHVKRVNSKREKRFNIIDDGLGRISQNIFIRNSQNAIKHKF